MQEFKQGLVPTKLDSSIFPIPVLYYFAKLLTCNHSASREIRQGFVPFVKVSTAVICLPISFLRACLVGLATNVVGLWPAFTATYANDNVISASSFAYNLTISQAKFLHIDILE